ncbi:MAG: hypothetical protein DWQ05_20340 [Calditrichaeota bacterium]|nr:MAG: hypothetical protein DWQ05_20340 [Calditrichota bacterium]
MYSASLLKSLSENHFRKRCGVNTTQDDPQNAVFFNSHIKGSALQKELNFPLVSTKNQNYTS